MSDIQDLIHKTSIDCIKQGERQATERIIKVLEEHAVQVDEGGSCWCLCMGIAAGRDWDYQEHLDALIKGEQK